MQISHIILKDFGRFDHLECDFAPGLNLIKGANEAGKSTLAEALATVLFVDPGKGALSKESKRWGGQSAPSLEAILDVEGKSFKLVKDFEKGTARIAGDDTEMMAGTDDSVDTWISEKTGMPSEEVFKATACVSQGEITRIENSIEAIRDKLESLVTGGKEDELGSEIIKKIDNRLLEVTMENAQVESLFKGLDYNINKLKREIEGFQAKRADLIQVEVAYKNVREDLAERKDNLKKAEENARLALKEAELSSEFEQQEVVFKQAENFENEIKKIRDELSRLRQITPEDLRKVEETQTTMGYYERERVQFQKEADGAGEEMEKCKIGITGPAITVLGLLGAGFSTVSHLVPVIPDYQQYMEFSVVACLGIVLFGISRWNSRKQKRKYLSDALGKITAKLDEVNEKFEQTGVQFRELLDEYGSESPDELKKNLWKFEEIKKQSIQMDNEYFRFLSGRSYEEIKRNRDGLKSELDSVTEKRRQYADTALDDSDIERERLVIEQIEERITDLERERLVLCRQMESAEGGSELLACYLERKIQVNSQLDNLKYELQVLGKTKECIDEAKQNVLMSKLEVLNNGVSEILNNLTSGKYTKVRFDKATLKFEVWIEDNNEWVDPEKVLSSSTIDQIYLAARLALADLISGHKNSMYILDDPFSAYDSERLDNVMSFLKDLSRDHQIFLLSSGDSYDRWADTTINL